MSASPAAPRIGVSSCLLGEKVRYDGGHKRDDFITDTLAPFVEFVPVCPEVEVGMGTPREPVRLVALADRVHMLGVNSGTDHTASMERYAARRAAALSREELSGYILKSDSPSCGMEHVRLHPPGGGVPDKTGTGLFAAALRQRMPLLPVEEEGRLRDPWLRENFIERLFAYRRVRALFAARWSANQVVRFHSSEKLLLMAHDRRAYEALGRLVAHVNDIPRADFAAQYQTLYMGALAKIARPSRHGHILLHIAGYFKKLLGEDDRAELRALIADYQARLVPLIAPITLLRHYLRRHDIEYLKSQTYLQPHPSELMLRNHV